MTYIINENLLEEIALHVGPKRFTFGKVYNAIKTWTESRFAHISELEWFNFLIEEPRTLTECIDKVCELSDETELTIMIEQLDVDLIIENIEPDHLEFTTKARTRTFIIPFNEIKFRYDSETETFINLKKKEK